MCTKQKHLNKAKFATSFVDDVTCMASSRVYCKLQLLQIDVPYFAPSLQTR